MDKIRAYLDPEFALGVVGAPDSQGNHPERFGVLSVTSYGRGLFVSIETVRFSPDDLKVILDPSKITHLTLQDNVYGCSRERGIYQVGTAYAVVDVGSVDKQKWYSISAEAKGTNIEDLGKLYNGIRDGSLRPTRSYEGAQTPPGADPLVVLTKKVEQLLKRRLDWQRPRRPQKPRHR